MSNQTPADHPTDHAADLALALALADAADVVTQDRFQALDLRVQTKPDTTPVSDADLAVEALLRDSSAAERPDDAVLGEEQGIPASGARRWILDPIDGTKNYVRGVPVWATLLALEVDGEITVGVVSAPALGTAVVGEPRRAVRTRTAGGIEVSKVARASAMPRSRYSSLDGWEEQRPAGGIPGSHAAPSGATAPSATSGRTAWSPRGRSTSAPSREVSLWDIAPLKVHRRGSGRHVHRPRR